MQFTERTRDGRLRAPVFQGAGGGRRRAGGARAAAGRGRPAQSGQGLLPRRRGHQGRPVRVLRARSRRCWCRTCATARSRCCAIPDGIDGKSFFQKDAPDHMPAVDPHLHPRGHPLRAGQRRRQPAVDGEHGLHRHAPLAGPPRPPRPARPGHVRPRPGGRRAPIDTVVEVALLVRDALSALGLEGVPKTSGGKGMHVLVPVERRYEHAEARGRSSRPWPGRCARTHPELITTALAAGGASRRADRRQPERPRPDDGLGVYSVRPRPGCAGLDAAGAGTSWTPELDPTAFTMEAVLERVSRLRRPRRAPPAPPPAAAVAFLGRLLRPAGLRLPFASPRAMPGGRPAGRARPSSRSRRRLATSLPSRFCSITSSSRSR